MALKTKEDVFKDIIAQTRPHCPHCSQEMSIWEVPPMPCDDGLGWGSPYLYMCFNDECPLYTKGWDHIKGEYGRTASYRCLCYPDSLNFECMSVFGPFGGTGQIVDENAMALQAEINEKVKKGMIRLDEWENAREAEPVLGILLDGKEPNRLRVRAAEIIGSIGPLTSVDALREQAFDNDILARKVEDALKQIHGRHFTRECPFCAEVIKRRAKICKHCGKDVAGV